VGGDLLGRAAGRPRRHLPSSSLQYDWFFSGDQSECHVLDAGQIALLRRALTAVGQTR
jgi:hypothetical protein